MSIADIKYKELIKDIYENGSWDSDKEVRAKYADGTPAYCKSVFGKQIIFEEDELPLLTCKKVFTKTAIKEMILFWIKQSVKKEDFLEDSVKIWDEWFKEDGTLGKSYAYQFESNPTKSIIKVDTKVKEIQDYIPYTVLDRYTVPHLAHSRSGEILENEKYGSYEILGKSLDEDYKYVVRFNRTNNIVLINRSDLNKNIVKDCYQKIGYNGFGCIGNIDNIKNISKIQLANLKQIWTNMLYRCYNPEDKDYNNYGAKGIFVDNNWQCFEFFVKDLKLVPQYFLAKKDNFKGWNLDKDYFNSNCYSKDTCVFLAKQENILYSFSKPFIVNGPLVNDLYISQTEAAKDLLVDSSSISAVLLNKYNTIKKHTVNYLETNDVYRYKISKNQVVELINNIKNNPTSKRLLTSFWNYEDVEDKALQECAFQTQWNVRGDKLDLILTQRSGDLGLGVPFNWFQYKVLQLFIAHCTGYKAGRFIHHIGNLHYYDRHESVLLNQLTLEEFEQPVIELNLTHQDYFDITDNDIEVKNYICGPYLSMEVAI